MTSGHRLFPFLLPLHYLAFLAMVYLLLKYLTALRVFPETMNGAGVVRGERQIALLSSLQDAG